MRLPTTAPERDPILPGVKELSRQIRELEQRVSSLEHRLATSAGHAGEAVGTGAAFADAALPTFDWTAGVAALAGKALLGIAGAYLLRALTEAGMLSRTMGIRAGMIYAVVWLYLASRAGPERKAAVAFNALTSVLVLGPLLWEAIIRFQVIATWSAAIVLIAFSTTGLALSWRNRNTTAARISLSASSLIAAILMVATRDLIPFTLALLVIGALVEFSVSRDHEFHERWLVSGLAGFSVFLFTYIIARPGGIPEGYAPMPPHSALVMQGLLVAIFTVSTLSRTFLQRRPFTLFETLLAVTVFLIGVGGALRVSVQDPAALFVVALCSLMAGAACYAISFAVLTREGRRNRNFYVYACFALLLVIAGSKLMFSGPALLGVLLGLALISCWAGLRATQHVLQMHGGIYLLLGMSFSELGAQSFTQFFGTAAESYPFGAATLAILVAFLCYVAVMRSKVSRWDQWLPALATSASLTWLAAGATASAIIASWPAQAILLRTAVLTCLAAVLCWAGARERRAELNWLMYAIMIVAAYKLLIQDFRQEQTLPLVVSLLLYGGTLMLLPRILRSRSFHLDRKDKPLEL